MREPAYGKASWTRIFYLRQEATGTNAKIIALQSEAHSLQAQAYNVIGHHKGRISACSIDLTSEAILIRCHPLDTGRSLLKLKNYYYWETEIYIYSLEICRYKDTELDICRGALSYTVETECNLPFLLLL